METIRRPIQIIRNPKRCGGAPTLGETRTTVHDIVSYFRLYGEDIQRVVAEALPQLTVEEVRAALDYYRDHTEEIDDILRRRRQEYERLLADTQPTR